MCLLTAVSSLSRSANCTFAGELGGKTYSLHGWFATTIAGNFWSVLCARVIACFEMQLRTCLCGSQHLASLHFSIHLMLFLASLMLCAYVHLGFPQFCPLPSKKYSLDASPGHIHDSESAFVPWRKSHLVGCVSELAPYLWQHPLVCPALCPSHAMHTSKPGPCRGMRS